MTANQINYAKYKEDQRSHQRNEALTQSGQELTKLDLAERARHNYVSENIDSSKAQSAMMQAVTGARKQAEEARHNRQDEAWYGVKYAPEYAKYVEYGAKQGGQIVNALGNAFNKVSQWSEQNVVPLINRAQGWMSAQIAKENASAAEYARNKEAREAEERLRRDGFIKVSN